jgi:hypothetical protein
MASIPKYYYYKPLFKKWIRLTNVKHMYSKAINGYITKEVRNTF